VTRSEMRGMGESLGMSSRSSVKAQHAGNRELWLILVGRGSRTAARIRNAHR
jgi:hypothetical protein